MFPYSRKSAQNYEIIPIFATAHTKNLRNEKTDTHCLYYIRVL